MKKYVRKVIKKLLVFTLAILAAVALCVPAVSRIAKADGHSFDNSDVMEDLSGLDFSDFPAVDGKEIQLVRFTEYCFTSYYQGSFGLYIYIYNPSRTDISSREGANTINIATRYKDGKPCEYANVDLKLCNYSTGMYSRLLYKFKVVGDELERIYANAKAFDLSKAERRYDVAGIQCWEKGTQTAGLKVNTASEELGSVKDYSISRTYYFTGYAKGYGNGAEDSSTLACHYEELATIHLELQHTNWRNDKAYKDYTYEEVNSVYFSIPNEVFDSYGSLQKIKAEWYEYKTNPIFVTKDEGAYNAFLDWIGVEIGEYKEALDWRVWWEETTEYDNSGTVSSFSALYNQTKGSVETDFYWNLVFLNSAKSVTCMDWLFYRDDPDSLEDYEVTRTEVEDWAKQYSLDNKSQGKVDARKTFWAEGLFSKNVDEGRKRGYNVQEISADEEVNLLEYKNRTFWEKLTGKYPTETAVTYNPIYLVTKADIKGTAGSISENLLVNERDVDNADGMNNIVGFRQFCQNALNNNEQPVLFRFANTDYYASQARFDVRGNGISDPDGYVCQQTCFLDFDIISLTFEKEGTETVLGAVADPIDIFNGTTPPTDMQISPSCGGCADFKSTLRIVFIVIVFLVVWKIYRKIRDSITLRRARRDQKKNRRWRK